MKPPKIGTRTWRSRQCGYAPPGKYANDENACGRAAIVHIAWERIPTPMSFVCELHVSELLQAYQHHAFHPLTPDCGMPGFTYYQNENTCRCGFAEQESAELETVEGAK